MCTGRKEEPVAYVPILKAKAGELQALEHATPLVRSRIRPVLELVPDPELVRNPGGGTQWRAWATSHHLAVVTAELAARR